VHFWKDGCIGTTQLTGEVGAGHESAGEILALGPDVAGLAVGDRVAIEAGIPCGRPACAPCRTGIYNQCELPPKV
jgi:L-iditol 2-dehydrogenase